MKKNTVEGMGGENDSCEGITGTWMVKLVDWNPLNWKWYIILLVNDEAEICVPGPP